MRGVSGKREELVEQEDGILSCRERERERERERLYKLW